MHPHKTTVERAFELAQSAGCRSTSEITSRLRAEGLLLVSRFLGNSGL